MPVGYLTIEST